MPPSYAETAVSAPDFTHRNGQPRQLLLDAFFRMPRQTVCFVPGAELFNPVQMLGSGDLLHFATCCRVARKQVSDIWASWDRTLHAVDLCYLEQSLGRFWDLHHDQIRNIGTNCKLRSASALYQCWPSTHWFEEASLPIVDHLVFESGDSSYNVWIFSTLEALPVLDRIVCDLYMRATWPQRGKDNMSATLLTESTDKEAFMRSILAYARKADARKRKRSQGSQQDSEVDEASDDGLPSQQDNEVEESSDDGLPAWAQPDWEFSMRSVEELMEQIWWDPNLLNGKRSPSDWIKVIQTRPWLKDGFLLPRRPQPTHGLSLLWGQESVFITWDKFELWVYGCYVD